MKLEKNKILIIGVIICVILFIGVYASILLGDDEAPTLDGNQIPVPRLEDGQKEYESKLDALNDLKEVKQTNAPSIYDERLLDSMGVYDPDLLEKEKMQMVDSIYRNGQIKYSDRYVYQKDSTPKTDAIDQNSNEQKDAMPKIEEKKVKAIIDAKELSLGHLLFFASNPTEDSSVNSKNTDNMIYVRVDGTQTVKTNFRLQMRLEKEALIDGQRIPRNTPLYGFISFKPNRVAINIENINHQPTKLKAFDLQDGSEGVYAENSFRAEATQEVIGDVVDDINMAGMPQVSGIRKIFQRNNRNIKVTVTDNYKLILKSQ
ncbi:conjugative transposon protein TraM [Yeosuana sp.]|uniref:conjugative transposon protein TraM n=1 Tax=Yeosuana sp. TaxID=2529388 RepID=UPI004054E13E